MIYRHEIEFACIAFTENSQISVTAHAVEVISVLLNSPLADPGPRLAVAPAEMEHRIRDFLKSEFPSMLDKVVDAARTRHQRPRRVVTGTDVLHFLVREWRPMEESRLAFIFDSN